MHDEQSQLSPSSDGAFVRPSPHVRQLRFLQRVMGIFALADVQSALWWNVKGELFANCSDTFWWGTADVEEITPERLPVLERAYADLIAISDLATEELAELYAARVRGLRPQGAAYPKAAPDSPHWDEVQQIIALFDACGPEREVDLTNPVPQPRTQ